MPSSSISSEDFEMPRRTLTSLEKLKVVLESLEANVLLPGFVRGVGYRDQLSIEAKGF
jgi:hypothetical protein